MLKKKEIYAITKFLATAHTYKPRKNIQIVLKKVFVSFTEPKNTPITPPPPQIKIFGLENVYMTKIIKTHGFKHLL